MAEHGEPHGGPSAPDPTPPLERPFEVTGRGGPEGPRHPSSRYLGLMIAVIASLLLNGLLALRLQDGEERENRLRAQLREQQEDLDALRGGLRSDGKDPLGRIASAVARLRGLAFRKAIRPEVLSPADFKERVRKALTQDQSRSSIEATAKVLVALGLVPEDLDLYETLVRVQEEQVAGFYDTDRRKLVVGAADARNPSPFDEVILAHEYTHALTDQHFDLRTLDRLQEDRKDDEATAFLALIEGDAVLLMTLYQEQVLTEEQRRSFISESLEVPRDEFDALPAFIQSALEFPYTRGVDFARELHKRGGFDLIDRAYRKPPTSTEQILHVNKYLDDRDEPVHVQMPNVARALGSGWRVIDRGGIGEFDVRAIADQYVPFSDARNAADGWDGGRYVGVSSSKGTVVALLTAWDSPTEAREAGEILGHWLPLRYRNEGRQFDPGGTGRGWAGRNGAGMVLRTGDRVLVLVGPEEDSVRRARSAFPSF